MRLAGCDGEAQRGCGVCASGGRNAEAAGGLTFADGLRAENGREARVRELSHAVGHGEFLRGSSVGRVERGVDTWERGSVAGIGAEGAGGAGMMLVRAGERGAGAECAAGVARVWREREVRVVGGRLDLLG